MSIPDGTLSGTVNGGDMGAVRSNEPRVVAWATAGLEYAEALE